MCGYNLTPIKNDVGSTSLATAACSLHERLEGIASANIVHRDDRWRLEGGLQNANRSSDAFPTETFLDRATTTTTIAAETQERG